MEFTYGMFTGFSGRLAATPWRRYKPFSAERPRLIGERGTDGGHGRLANSVKNHHNYRRLQIASDSWQAREVGDSDLNKPRFTKKVCASYNVLRRNGLELKSTLVRSDKVSGCNPAR